MKFDPDISTWTDEQLEEGRRLYIRDMEGFKVAFEPFPEQGDPFIKMYEDVIDIINTEILERGLKLIS